MDWKHFLLTVELFDLLCKDVTVGLIKIAVIYFYNDLWDHFIQASAYVWRLFDHI